jgi:hypothetical protein
VIRPGFLVLALVVPAGAEGLAGQALCEAAWSKLSDGVATVGALTGSAVGQDGDWCVVDGPVLDLDGQYLPDWHLDRLRFRGSALGWIADGSVLPEGLEIVVEGFRLVVQTGNPQMDWLFAAQSRPNAINAEAALSWDPVAKVLQLEGLSVDFPGENLVQASGTLTGVDLSSTGAMQMSTTSFALTEFDARVTTHGMFEWYVLMALGPVVLPYEGDIDAAAGGIRADLLSMVGDLPETSVSASSKTALRALIGELPNPSGDLNLSLRAGPGIGPVRFGGYAITGVPQTLAEASPLFQGVTVDVGWTHADAP